MDMRGRGAGVRFGSLVTGFVLAIVLAYGHDVSVPAVSPDGHPQAIVNWEVLRHVADGVGTWLRLQVDTLLTLIDRRG